MGGRGGLFREYDWNGKVLWEHKHVGQHHDFRRLPNGNTLFLGWEVVPPEIADRIPGGLAGTQHADGCMYGDTILEITPEGKTVWEWHACRDMEVEKYPLISNQLRDEFAHANAISPLENGDIYVSFRRLNMIGLIDKQTKKMKWQHRDDSFGMQHDCAPLGNGNITLFANGINTTEQSVLPRDRARSADAQDGVGVSRQARLYVLQPAHQRRAAADHAATR